MEPGVLTNVGVEAQNGILKGLWTSDRGLPSL
jgi:hypothetical protein